MSVNTKCIHTIKKNGIGKDKDKKLSIILLNSLCGYRMKSYGPRCLLKLKTGETIIESQIKILKECYPNSEIIVTIGFDGEKIVKKKIQGVRFVENQLYDSTNIAEEIRLGINNCETGNVLLIQGEILFNHTIIDNITRDGSCVICVDNINNDNDDVGATIVDGYVTILAHGLQPKFGGIAFISESELNYFKHTICSKDNANMYFFELLNILANKYNKIRAIQPPNETVLRIESIKDIKQ